MTDSFQVAIFDNRGTVAIETFASSNVALAWRDGFRCAVQLYEGHTRAYAIFDPANALEMEKIEAADQVVKAMAMVDAAHKRAEEQK